LKRSTRHAVEEAQEVVVEALLVVDDDRLVDAVDVAERHDLRQLLEGPDAAGKREEGARALLHDALPLAHRVHGDQLVGLVVGELPILHEFRDHADDVAPGLLNRLRDGAHHPHVAAAVDEAPSVRDHGLPDRVGGRIVPGLEPFRGTAVDAQELCHRFGESQDGGAGPELKQNP
jgi:hypothetical protein